MEVFPCPLELTVASALLLLSTTPPTPLSPPHSVKKISSAESLGLSDSKSCSSSVISEDGSPAEIRDHRLRFVAVVSRFHEMKLKVVRKSRSKTMRIFSDRRKIFTGKAAMVASKSASEATTEASASSCLSSSSAISSARTCKSVTRIGKRDAMGRVLKRKSVGSALMHRRAEAILKLLTDDGCASEVKIRQLLGDSPDTSKALRMLLKLDAVKRSGAGGRHDPYIYKKAQDDKVVS